MPPRVYADRPTENRPGEEIRLPELLEHFLEGSFILKKESSGVSTVGRVIYEPPSPGEWTTERRRDEAKLGCLGKKRPSVFCVGDSGEAK